ncbi:MAG: hypothetical protein ACFFD2_20515 [Promethearchaeota archaeon]
MSDEPLEEKMKISKAIREILVKANQATKDNKLKEAAKYYESAAELSKSLGHMEIAQNYLKKVAELKEEARIVSTSEEISQDPLSKVIKLADKEILAGNFAKAAKIYEESARIHPNEAKKLLSEAMALRKKEKDLIISKKEMIRKADTTQSYEETLEKIKVALENNQYKELVILYGRAAILAEKLGKRKEAGEYRKFAIESKKKASQELKMIPKEGRINLVQQYTEALKQIKVFLDEKRWQEAADGYMKAAKLAIELEEFNRAKIYKEKAIKLQEQANAIELESRLKKKRLELLEEIKTSLDKEKNTDKIAQNYREILNISKDLKITEDIDEINENLREIEKIKRRKKALSEANKALEQQDHSSALEFFQKALSISIDLNEPSKIEEFRNVIEKLKEKVDKISRDRKIIEQRAELLAEAKVAIKEVPPNIEKAINNYKEAARISIELGEDEIAQSYLQTAKRIDEDKNLIIERENFVKDAEAAIKEKKYMIASNYYKQAAKFSEKLGDREDAKKFQKKAKALKELAEEF